MNRRLEIATKLERSLRNQVRAPQLERRFNAAVWARIEAEKVHAVPPTARNPRWLLVLNGICVVVTLAIILVIGAQQLTSAATQLSLPQLTLDAAAINQFVKTSATWITGGALALGLIFTPLGRSLRNELRAMF